MFRKGIRVKEQGNISAEMGGGGGGGGGGMVPRWGAWFTSALAPFCSILKCLGLVILRNMASVSNSLQ